MAIKGEMGWGEIKDLMALKPGAVVVTDSPPWKDAAIVTSTDTTDMVCNTAKIDKLTVNTLYHENGEEMTVVSKGLMFRLLEHVKDLELAIHDMQKERKEEEIPF